ncbi:MFS transporter [Streptomyces tateyamensis]|uniref:MFS transporter n=1 Tax=Streptomyces tateyamensis TaxID=565073 RepID=A0A2V4NUT7_9ACTN|nr:MFS transporter [Streptomyces tateyamensis]PYC80504.1 MFS transporter [Streptomyces tateyamensis]
MSDALTPAPTPAPTPTPPAPQSPSTSPSSLTPPLPLARNRRFQLLWTGAAASVLGARLADTAFPLLLLARTGSAALAGAFGAVQLGATVLCGLHGGAVADRHDRRRVLLAADGIRFLATAGVVAAQLLGRLAVAHLLLVAAVVGAATAYGGPVRPLAVRAVVPPEQLGQALTQEELRGSGAALLGPPLAGLLFSLGRVVPVLGTALGSLFSFFATLAVRFDGRPAGHRRQAGDGNLWAGARVLLASPLLRATLGAALPLNVAGSAMTLAVIVLLRDRGTGSTAIGLVLAGEAVGAIAGAFLVGRLHRLAGPGRLLLAASWLCVPLTVGLLLPGGPVTVFLVLAAMNLAMPALRVMIDVLIFRQVPDELRGRVIAVTMTTMLAGVPAGTLAVGLLLDRFSPATTLLMLAGALALGLLPASCSRALRAARWPG